MQIYTKSCSIQKRKLQKSVHFGDWIPKSTHKAVLGQNFMAWKPLKRQGVLRETWEKPLWPLCENRRKVYVHHHQVNISIQKLSSSGGPLWIREPSCCLRLVGWQSDLWVSTCVQSTKWSYKDRREEFPRIPATVWVRKIISISCLACPSLSHLKYLGDIDFNLR